MDMKIRNISKFAGIVNSYYMLLKNNVIFKFCKERHQSTRYTEYDRYPKIFSVCKEYFKEKFPSKELKILSFGCSTGEECFTIRKYFPSAKIIGVDIDKSALHICKKRNTDRNISFVYSDHDKINDIGSFDIIFCMSILCRWPDTKYINNITNVYSFSKFQNTIRKLDKILAKNGLLVIYNSNFVFSDTSIYCQYDALCSPEIIESGFVHKFDNNNNKIKESQYRECVFIKRHQIYDLLFNINEINNPYKCTNF